MLLTNVLRVKKKQSASHLGEDNHASESTGLDPEADSEDAEPLIDPQVLARLKFS